MATRKGVKRTRTNGAPKKRARFDFSGSVPVRAAGMRGQRNLRTGGFLGIENKFLDSRVNDVAFSGTWAGGEMEDATLLSVSAVQQGVGENQRDGRKYAINSVFIRGTLELPVQESLGAPPADVVARVLLVLDKQTNGAQLNAEDVMLTVASAHDIDSFRNLQFVERFQVLADKKVRIPLTLMATNEGAVNLFAHGSVSVPFKMSFIFKTPLRVTCKATAAAIASIVDNSIHVIGTANNTSLTINYTSRLRFTG